MGSLEVIFHPVETTKTFAAWLRDQRGPKSREAFARECDPPLSAKTIQNLEEGVFEPSYRTLRAIRVGHGLAFVEEIPA